jgi:hypothetical protein
MEGIKNLFNKCKELLGASSSELKSLGKELEKETNMVKNLHIRELHQLQQLVPGVIITGSSALFLHGIKLKRWMKAKQVSDIDIIIPFFIDLSECKDIDFQDAGSLTLSTLKNSFSPLERAQKYDDKNEYSFDYTSKFGREYSSICTVDIKIDNKAEYETVEYQGDKFKVAKLEDIIIAKLKYGRHNPKHIADLYEMTGKLIPVDVPEKKENINRGGS